jgi:hypothetical protein
MPKARRIHRVVLDDQLKREYQPFLQADNRDRPESDGRPPKSLEEVHESASSHDLPVLDDAVQIPDLRIEYEWPDGRRETEHVEVLAPHYRARTPQPKRGHDSRAIGDAAPVLGADRATASAGDDRSIATSPTSSNDVRRTRPGRDHLRVH